VPVPVITEPFFALKPASDAYSDDANRAFRRSGQPSKRATLGLAIITPHSRRAGDARELDADPTAWMLWNYRKTIANMKAS
jgi:hypothetical protein